MNYQTTARELLKGRELGFTPGNVQDSRYAPEWFREFVEMAVGYGATYISVGRFPFRYGTTFLPDNHDPYASWCNSSFNLLWTFPPPELQAWIPLDEARRRQDFLSEQIAELRRHGLKASIEAIEPLWLPEGVYRAHPRWRGAQCELGRIARRAYFAPSIDEPEVQNLYRAAMREMATRFPEIDRLNFMSNDSGGGIAWTPNLYPGMNGPAKWRRRDPGERIAQWLGALQEGAAAAGVTVGVHLHSSGLSPEIVSAARAQLKPGLYLNWGGGPGAPPWHAASAALGSGIWSIFYPAAGLGDHASFVSGLQNVYANGNDDRHFVAISADDCHLPRARTLIEAYLREPERGTVARARVLHVAAAEIAGTPDIADGVVEAWQSITRAVHCALQIRQKGASPALAFCTVGMRWLTRPLVPQPRALSDDETAHYRHFLFSVNNDDENASFHFVFGKPVFNGESVMWMARWCLQEAIETLQGARGQLEGLAAHAPEAGAQRLRLEAARAAAYACLLKNAQNVIRYQYALDVAHHPQFGWNVMDYDENILYDQRGLQLRKIAREELDNTQELIELIEAYPHELVVQARAASEESVFMLGPDLAGDLRRKMNVMLDHWQEYEQLFPATRVWEYEPASGDTTTQLHE